MFAFREVLGEASVGDPIAREDGIDAHRSLQQESGYGRMSIAPAMARARNWFGGTGRL